MVALVSYSSSDEEDEPSDKSLATNTRISSSKHKGKAASISGDTPPKPLSGRSPKPVTTCEPGVLSAAIQGPQLPDFGTEYALSEDSDFEMLSPYSKNRVILRNLTMSKQPNFEIPPSPKGSPSNSTEAKFNQFLELKKKGVHFNQKLARSTAIKNPSLMQSLMDFAEIDHSGQYVTTLPKSLWDPGAFPSHAFVEELNKSQQKILNLRENSKAIGQRESVDFVSATSGRKF
ncbi:Meiotically up-regulated protein [Erysiphe necator]|nr:Meiotically up-regulated protein [Erysiphe necator]